MFYGLGRLGVAEVFGVVFEDDVGHGLLALLEGGRVLTGDFSFRKGFAHCPEAGAGPRALEDTFGGACVTVPAAVSREAARASCRGLRNSYHTNRPGGPPTGILPIFMCRVVSMYSS